MNDILDKAQEYERTYHTVGRAHYLASDHCAALNRLFGIPVIIITAVVGTTIFGTLNQNPNPNWKIAAGLIPPAGTVLALLQTSLGFAQTAQKHKAAGESYRAIQRRFETFQLKYAPANLDQRNAAMSEFEELVKQLDDLPKEFPTVPDRYYERAKEEEFKGKGETLSKKPAPHT